MKRKLLMAVGGLVALVVAVPLVLTQPVGAVSQRGPVVEGDADQLRATVLRLTTNFHPRDTTHPANLAAVAAWLHYQLSSTSKTVRFQEWKVNGVAYQNVSALYGPATGERVVVGAHYDSFEPRPGADDNASGVAVLLELARLFQDHPPPKTVELVFWSLEEPPHFRTEDMGSFVHAKSLAEAKVAVAGVLSIESVGFFRDEEGSQKFPVPGLSALYSTKANYLAVVGNLGQIGITRKVKAAMRTSNTIPIFSINAPAAVPGIDFSDHLNYWKFGFPAVMVTDTAFNRNPNYHTDTDTLETLDFARMVEVTEAVFEAAWQLAL